MSNKSKNGNEEKLKEKIKETTFLQNKAREQLCQLEIANEYLATQRTFLANKALDLAEQAKSENTVKELKTEMKAHLLGITEMNEQIRILREKKSDLEYRVDRQSSLITILFGSLEKEMMSRSQIPAVMEPSPQNKCLELSTFMEKPLDFDQVVDSIMDCIINGVFDGVLSPEHAVRLRAFLEECASTLISFHSFQMGSFPQRREPLVYPNSDLDSILEFLSEKIEQRRENGVDWSMELPENCTLGDKILFYAETLVKLDEEKFEDLKNQLKNSTEAAQNGQKELEATHSQLKALKTEREQLISSLHRKHGESVSFYERLKAMEVQMKQDREKLAEKSLEAEKSRNYEEKMSKIAQKINKIMAILNSDPIHCKLSDVFVSVLDPQSDIEDTTSLDEYLSVSRIRAGATEADLAKARAELHRLKSHLLSNEDNYTADLVSAQQIEKSLRKRLTQVEDELLGATEAANEAKSKAFHERENMRAEIEDLSEECLELNQKKEEWQTRALTDEAAMKNLELVLADFHTEKTAQEKEIEDLRVLVEGKTRGEVNLINENDKLQKRLESLADELKVTCDQREQLQSKIDRLKSKLSLESSAKESVEKSLNSRKEEFIEIAVVKNILLNYLSAPNHQKEDLLRLIGRILLFTDDELGKVGLSAGSVTDWISTMLIPQNNEANNSTTSLSSEFISFLEREASISPINEDKRDHLEQ